MKLNFFQPITFILLFFIFMAMLISYQYLYHQFQVKTLITRTNAQHNKESSVMSPGMSVDYSLVPKSEIYMVEDEHHSLLASMVHTIFLYLPAALLILLISFVTAVGAAYNPFSPFARIFKWPIHLIDSIPLIFWIIIGLIIVFRIFSHDYWGDTFFRYLYYPSLSFSYGMALIVIFYQQNKRTIAEIRSQNILNGEMVTGISHFHIIMRLFWYHFAKTIIIRQFIYTLLYLLLFDYCLMYTFEDYRQIDCGFTPLTVKAGLYLLRVNRFELLGNTSLMNMYQHLHDAAFYLILALALICFFILFMVFDRKDITND